MAGLVRMQGRVGRPILIALIAIVVVAALGYAYASPYIALDRLKRAADSRDVETVNAYVDYPALRDSLKLQVTGLLTRRLDVQHNGNPLAAIGAMIGVALIGPLVDAYATPDGVAALLNGMPPRGEPGERPPPPPAAQTDNPPQTPPPAAGQANANSKTPPQPPQTTAGYRGLNEFVVSYQHGVGDTRYAAIFRRQGLFTWKLSAVDLNG
ncbi:DUF2939 domain-containing protein [Paraburkholderia caribensis]|uniref:DUF2939 domain-containing protein n=1 Tax=Paraburkholderia caribensis TaxID=75105 RepID=UPI00078CBD7C|nr:DUF2939 domain-containing protein [Paraburkholderia caribensis]AMV42808.1 hypothetical protein ATN79_08980 [Paraburkholderia caribensis]MDR6380057.1 hypothetical protein [Paraburkholderia caribensis]CAG9194473.1 conserved hypothetical protein [Paraburkholderia caribensis]